MSDQRWRLDRTCIPFGELRSRGLGTARSGPHPQNRKPRFDIQSWCPPFLGFEFYMPKNADSYGDVVRAVPQFLANRPRAYYLQCGHVKGRCAVPIRILS